MSEALPTTVTDPSSGEADEQSMDQRFELQSIMVAKAEKPLPREHAIRAQHSAAQLALVAQAGAWDAYACQADSDLGALLPAQIILNLEIEDSGRVLGGATHPSGGLEGIAALADCLLQAATSWRFPARDLPGRTVLVAPYQFQRESER